MKYVSALFVVLMLSYSTQGFSNPGYSISLHGSECTADSSALWYPTINGMYGARVSGASADIICPIPSLKKEGYRSDFLSYVIVEGKNVENIRLCTRTPFGNTVCGASGPIGNTGWILYKPAYTPNNSQNLMFISARLAATGATSIKGYIVVFKKPHFVAANLSIK